MCWLAISLFAAGRIKPVMYSEIYPLERVADGLSAVEQRRTWGKVIIRVKDEKIAKL
jgi:NADPH:quinone reductase-like Zn-dependent oxidoreductase